MIKEYINNCALITQSCVFCDLPSSTNSHVCDDCWLDLPWQQQACLYCAIPLTTSHRQICRKCLTQAPLFNQTIAAFNYQFPIDIVIPQIKNQRARFHLHWLAHALIKKLYDQTAYQLPQAIIPVPQSTIKHLIKGYNQTEYLCGLLSKQLQVKTLKSLVLKNRQTTSQAKLSAKQRKKNLINAFTAATNTLHHVAIVDDVMTTGSTVNEIAKALKASGIKRVDVWILARTLE